MRYEQRTRKSTLDQLFLSFDVLRLAFLFSADRSNGRCERFNSRFGLYLLCVAKIFCSRDYIEPARLRRRDRHRIRPFYFQFGIGPGFAV